MEQQKERLVSASIFTTIIQDKKHQFTLSNKDRISKEVTEALNELLKEQNILQGENIISQFNIQQWQKKKLNDFLLLNLAILEYADKLVEENIQQILVRATTEDMGTDDYIEAVVNHELQINTLSEKIFEAYKRMFDDNLVYKEIRYCKKCNLKYTALKKLLMFNLNKATFIAETTVEILYQIASELNNIFKENYCFKLRIDDDMAKRLGLDEDNQNALSSDIVATNDVKEVDTQEIKYEADVRKLEQVVLELGYNLVRQTGSHRIYKNKGGSEIVIPFHTNKDLGKGLSLKIQKKIVNY